MSVAAVNCGVPQGSVLRTLLFFINIKDLIQAIKLCQVHHFADDTNLLWLKNCIKKLKKIVNTELKHPSNWLDGNEISLNVKKTEMVIFKSMPKKLKVLQR